MDRIELLAWAKKRALDYVDNGDLISAFASFSGDIQKHPETRSLLSTNTGLSLLMEGMQAEQDKDADAMRRWINGFN